MALKGSGKREVIREEALKLFAARGVDAVSIQDIASACDMAKPNLYAHFKSKDDLVRDLFEQGYRDYGRMMTEAVESGGPFRRKLDRLVRLICRLHDEDNPRFRFIVMTQHANLPDVPIDETNPIEIIVRLVAAAMAAGEIPQRSAELVAAGIVGLVVQPATFLLYGRIGSKLGDAADDIVSMCMRVAA